MEMLLKKKIGTARFTPGAISFLRYPLASGPEGETLEGRKMAMAGTGVAVSGTGSMPTLLNDRKRLLLTQEGMASHSARKKYKEKGGAGSRRQASSLPCFAGPSGHYWVYRGCCHMRYLTGLWTQWLKSQEIVCILQNLRSDFTRRRRKPRACPWMNVRQGNPPQSYWGEGG